MTSTLRLSLILSTSLFATQAHAQCAGQPTTQDYLDCLNNQVAALSSLAGSNEIMIDFLEGERLAMQAEIVDLQLTVAELTTYIDVDTSSDTVSFVGANVYVQSGSGATDDFGAPTGLGNLIVGYSEDAGSNATRTGSHTLVVGPEHSWTGVGGAVFGYENEVHGDYASAVGGKQNEATGDYSSATGGQQNIASGNFSRVGGGRYNDATGSYSVASAGFSGTATASYSAMHGGYSNDATGYMAATLGGRYNLASSSYSVVTGGYSNEATGYTSSVTAGYNNYASGSYASVTGGSNNGAIGTESTVTGGNLYFPNNTHQVLP